MTGATAGIADIKNENSKFRAITTWSRGVERTHRVTAPKDGLGCSEQSSELFAGCFHRRSTRTTSRKQAAFAVKIRFTPITGIKRPPSAGPTIPEILNCKPFKVATEASSVPGTSCVTIAVETGALKAKPAPMRNIQNKMSQGLSKFSQLKITKPNAPAASHRLIAHSSFFRLTRSAKKPAGIVKRKKGSAAVIEINEIKNDGHACVFIRKVAALS